MSDASTVYEAAARAWQACALAVYVADVEALLDMAGGEDK